MPQNSNFKQGSHFLLPCLLKLYQVSAEGLQLNNIFFYSKYNIWIQKQVRIALVFVWKIF